MSNEKNRQTHTQTHSHCFVKKKHHHLLLFFKHIAYYSFIDLLMVIARVNPHVLLFFSIHSRSSAFCIWHGDCKNLMAKKSSFTARTLNLFFIVGNKNFYLCHNEEPGKKEICNCRCGKIDLQAKFFLNGRHMV